MTARDGKRILAVGAHPDDIEIGCGGTLSVFKNKGYDLIHCVVTSGEEGSVVLSKSALAEKREGEARESAKILGASQVHFLREPDGLTHYSKELKIKLIALIRELKPEIVFTHAISDHFPDHRVVCELTLAAILAASGPWYPDAREGAPHAVRAVYGYEVWNPIPVFQLAVDVSGVFERKVQALKAHASQVGGVDYVGAVQGLAQYRGVMTMTGSHAEVFEIIRESRYFFPS